MAEMDEFIPRVIKQPDAERVSVVPMETPFVPEAASRIPHAWIDHDRSGEAPEDVAAARRILDADLTELDDEPFVLEDFFPLPPREDEETPPAEATDEEPEEEIQPTREEIVAEWQARLEAAVDRARAEAHEAGHAEGHAEAEAALRAEVDAAKAAYAADVARLQEAWQEHVRAAEPMIAALAFRIAETILDAPLPDDLVGLSQRALAEAVEHVAHEPSINVTLHPVDYLRLQEAGVEEQLQAVHSGLRFHPDAALKQGDWVVESPSSTTRRLEEELLLDLRKQLGIDPGDE